MDKNYSYFINTDLGNYIGEWIAILNGKIVSHGKDIKKMHEEARAKYPKKNLWVTRVPDRENCIF